MSTASQLTSAPNPLLCISSWLVWLCCKWSTILLLASLYLAVEASLWDCGTRTPLSATFWEQWFLRTLRSTGGECVCPSCVISVLYMCTYSCEKHSASSAFVEFVLMYVQISCFRPRANLKAKGNVCLVLFTHNYDVVETHSCVVDIGRIDLERIVARYLTMCWHQCNVNMYIHHASQ